MGLPDVRPPVEALTLADGTVCEVRGMTRAEVLSMQGLEGAALEAALIGAGMDAPAEAAEAWYARAPSQDAESIAQAVMRLSGMGAAEGNGSSGAS